VNMDLHYKNLNKKKLDKLLAKQQPKRKDEHSVLPQNGKPNRCDTYP
jgi:hypothetical protein